MAKVITTIQNLLQRHATRNKVLFLFIITFLIYGIMLWITIPKVMSYSNGNKILDMLPTGYSVEYAKNLLTTLGDEGRSCYLYRQIPIDMLYPVFFAITYSLLLTFVFKSGFSPESKMNKLGIIPLLAGLFDYLENIGVILLLNSFPDLSDSLIKITNLFTITKSAFTTLFFILLIVGLIAFAHKRLAKKDPLK